ncbi:ATP-dependent helicase [Yinghuangia seranimata]|uniref:ATP-dependent helicase n=1 Tax=Yinghuangia seranimata TaxID=408067 RepID=UPI00248CD9D1|nr:ATP-dependent helicase [Yinghuangia seranimata]MDI2130870.1 ATP-dependent helicase [Yinghuangia seranimata]
MALTPEQQAVVAQPADAAVLVVAGAGAGKTHTLVRRLERLTSDEDVRAGEILALTFSRAAVRELRSRITGAAGAARAVRVATFDSWALEILTELAADVDWQSRSFDDRIEAATDLVAKGLADELYEDDLRHVLVDEVQDLVGARRELVEALLDRYDCGFTVVGDPAQSVYGFQIDDPAKRAGEVNRFFDWLRGTFGDELVELELTRNFRVREEEAGIALPFGPELRGRAEHHTGSSDAEELHRRLKARWHDTLHLGDLDDPFVCDALRSYEGSTAILCRTNGQALLVSEDLHRAGVPHLLQRSAQDRVVPGWVAGFIAASTTPHATRDVFERYLSGAAPHVDAAMAWGALVRATGRGAGGDTVDMMRLRSLVAAGRVPDEITAPPSADLVVSSLHRAKGLEFDRVLVVDPGGFGFDREYDHAEEARLLYVGMTRARDQLMRLSAPHARTVRIDKRTGRWARFGYQAWMRHGLELQAGDVHATDPAGTHLFTADPTAVWRHLESAVQAGDPVVLRRVDDGAEEPGMSPPYLVLVDDVAVGAASVGFRTALHRHMPYGRRNWPVSITGVYIEAVETVAGSDAAGKRAGIDTGGIWPAPRIGGLGRFTYDKSSDPTEGPIDE